MEGGKEKSTNLGGLRVPTLEVLVVRGEHGAFLAELVDILEVLGHLRFEQAGLLLGIGVAAQFPLEVVVLLFDLLKLLANVGHILQSMEMSTC